jgi:hypothetical protein
MGQLIRGFKSHLHRHLHRQLTRAFCGVTCSAGLVLVQFEHPYVQDGALLQRGAQSPVQAVLEVQLAMPADDVGEQVAVERRIGGEHGVQIQHVLRGDKLIEPDWPRRDLGPFPARLGMVRVGPAVPDPLEDHVASVDEGVRAPAGR